MIAIGWTLYAFLLLSGPAAAGALLAIRFGERSAPKFASWGLVASGTSALVSFYSYLGGFRLGLIWSYALVIGSWTTVVVLTRRMRDRIPWRDLSVPLLLWMAATLFVVALGFLWGGSDQPLQTASFRFSHDLPNDNTLPAFFGDSIWDFGRHKTPEPNGEWRSSDRPPLQIGYYLQTRAFEHEGRELTYQVMGVTLQQLWVVGAWALCRSARIRRPTQAIVLVAVLMSDIAIVHGFFIWPKLIAVGFVLAIGSVVLTERWRTDRFRLSDGVLLGALTALAVSAHGTTVYAIVAVGTVALLRGRPGRCFLLGAVISALALYSPWLAYREWFDPSVGRVEKINFAGVDDLTSRSTLGVMLDAYVEAGPREILRLKLGNLEMITGGLRGLSAEIDAVETALAGDPGSSVRALRGIRFFSIVHQVGILLFAPLIAFFLSRSRRRIVLQNERLLSMRLALTGSIALGAFALLQFGNTISEAWLHVGALSTPVMISMACILIISAYSRIWAIAIAATNAMIVLSLYTPFVSTGRAQLAVFSPALALTAVVSLCGFIAVAAVLEAETPFAEAERLGPRPGVRTQSEVDHPGSTPTP